MILKLHKESHKNIGTINIMAKADSRKFIYQRSTLNGWMNIKVNNFHQKFHVSQFRRGKKGED